MRLGHGLGLWADKEPLEHAWRCCCCCMATRNHLGLYILQVAPLPAPPLLHPQRARLYGVGRQRGRGGGVP